jgi:hypothetical protein
VLFLALHLSGKKLNLERERISLLTILGFGHGVSYRRGQDWWIVFIGSG